MNGATYQEHLISFAKKLNTERRLMQMYQNCIRSVFKRKKQNKNKESPYLFPLVVCFEYSVDLRTVNQDCVLREG